MVNVEFILLNSNQLTGDVPDDLGAAARTLRK